MCYKRCSNPFYIHIHSNARREREAPRGKELRESFREDSQLHVSQRYHRQMIYRIAPPSVPESSCHSQSFQLLSCGPSLHPFPLRCAACRSLGGEVIALGTWCRVFGPLLAHYHSSWRQLLARRPDRLAFGNPRGVYLERKLLGGGY